MLKGLEGCPRNTGDLQALNYACLTKNNASACFSFDIQVAVLNPVPGGGCEFVSSKDSVLCLAQAGEGNGGKEGSYSKGLLLRVFPSCDWGPSCYC